MNLARLAGERVPIALSPEEQAKLEGLEHRLAELTAEVGKLAQAFGRESGRSPAHDLVTGCLECLLVDRLRPAGEALAALYVETSPYKASTA
ncbi:MAG TPA: hypothetical protein VHU81_03005 [Thermoanaerobaculia bacterium]|jgi:hypothetical protein|nr:hypothetical protein [Thermoanaerobaculia bacterium]